jgi:hypothetical protein
VKRRRGLCVHCIILSLPLSRYVDIDKHANAVISGFGLADENVVDGGRDFGMEV